MKDFTITHIGHTELSLPMPFKFIPAKGKTFMFQADDGSNLGTKSEGIPITFEKDFWICAYQTTQEFWSGVVIKAEHKSLKAYPSYFDGKTRPLERVSWDDIQIFIEALNQLFRKGKITFKNNNVPNGQFGLPSETQWEYAADAGQGLVFSGSQNLHDVGWFMENSFGQTMPVGIKQPNAWGLYDMSGNVLEWCADSYAQNIEEIPKNGLPNLKKNGDKVLRGGSFNINTDNCRLRDRSIFINSYGYNDGFRLVFSPVTFTKASKLPNEPLSHK